MKRRQKLTGFTLVELISAIVLIAIVSVVVIPKFSSRGGFTEYALRDEIAVALRFAQQRAMYDHDLVANNCYRFYWDSNGFGPQRNGNYFAAYAGAEQRINLSGDYSSVTLSPASGEVFFDRLGNAREGNCTTGALLTMDISITDSVSLALRVHSTGYVQSL